MKDNPNTEQTKTCNGDCLKCNVQQRIYCAAQMGNIALQRIDALTAEVKALRELLADKAVFNPLQPEQEAQ